MMNLDSRGSGWGSPASCITPHLTTSSKLAELGMPWSLYSPAFVLLGLVLISLLQIIHSISTTLLLLSEWHTVS